MIPPAAVGKLTFVHGCVHSWAKAANIDRKVDAAATTASDETLRAVIAGLRTPRRRAARELKDEKHRPPKASLP